MLSNWKVVWDFKNMLADPLPNRGVEIESVKETNRTCGNRRTNEHSWCCVTGLRDGKAADNGKYAHRDHDGEVIDAGFDRIGAANTLEVDRERIEENKVAEEEPSIRGAPKRPLLEQSR